MGGKWFNCDLTNTRYLGIENNGKYIYKALKTDKQFKSCDVFSEHRSVDEEKCDTNIEDLMRKNTLGLLVKKLATYLSFSEIKEAYSKVHFFKHRKEKEQQLAVPEETLTAMQRKKEAKGSEMKEIDD